VEKVGPFLETAPAAWGEVAPLIPAIGEQNTVAKFMSLYKAPQQIYRAGVAVAQAPNNLPAGVKHEVFSGGKYSKFVLTGPYTHLPEASGRVFEIVKQKKIVMREDWYIENYLNDPRTTPAEQLVTEILIPTV
jgi:DNA gyrase inhibitor GyrI